MNVYVTHSGRPMNMNDMQLLEVTCDDIANQSALTDSSWEPGQGVQVHSPRGTAWRAQSGEQSWLCTGWWWAI